jgi:hypothetical protein
MTSTSNTHSKTSGNRAVLYMCIANIQVKGVHNEALENQRRELYEHAAEDGYEIVGEHVDAGRAGPAKDRPAFQTCMALLRAGEADMLMVSSLDRIGRDVTDVVACVDELDHLGVSLVALDSQIDLAFLRGWLTCARTLGGVDKAMARISYAR